MRQRTRAKNQVHAALIRNLRPRQPMRDLFGTAGRRWLTAQTLPIDEQETVASCLREIDFLAGEIEQLEQAMALEVLGDEQMRRLLALPGISGVAACTLLAAIATSRASPTPATSSATSGSTRVSASPVRPTGPEERQHAVVARHARVQCRSHSGWT